MEVTGFSNGMNISPDTEIRKLPASVKLKLGQILDVDDAWKDLMSCIPKDVNSSFPKKYSYDHIMIIERASLASAKTATEILIEEWGTSGRIRPTVQHFLDLLCSVPLYRAANYLAVDLLGGNCVQLFRWMINYQLLDRWTNFVQNADAAEKIPNPLCVSYAILWHITNKFDDRCFFTEQGNKLGKGAFGVVYLGTLPSQNKVAVKKLESHEFLHRQFTAEIAVWAKYKHDNLLPLIGFCEDSPSFCLIYAYMSNGSLEECLACKHSSSLPWEIRLNIAIDSAKGIVHLHTHGEKPFVHRDVKSANILLDESFRAKVGDYGLAREGCSGSNLTTTMTRTIFGTSAYMAPEAFKGDVSTKMDTYSFGVILLELLTSLPPTDVTRKDGIDLISYMENTSGYECMDSFLDSTAGAWEVNVVQGMSNLAYNCKLEKRNRLLMTQVLKRLQELQTFSENS